MSTSRISTAADRCAEGDARRQWQALADGRSVLRLWHLPCRRTWPRQGGDLVLHAGQRSRAKRGIMLSFVSAFLQALTAIAVMTLAFLVLRGTSISMTDATLPRDRELRHDHALWRLAAVAKGRAAGRWACWARVPRTAFRQPIAHADHAHGHATTAMRIVTAMIMRTTIHSTAHAAGEVCDTAAMPCARPGDDLGRYVQLENRLVGHRRGRPSPLLRRADRTQLRLPERPLGRRHPLRLRHGARHGHHRLDTATLAVTAKNWAVAYAGDGRTGNRVHAAIEISGAAFVFLLGLLLLSASLAG